MVNRSRSWLLTNNYKETEPIETNELLNLIKSMNGITYTAFQLEQGEQGTKHHQIYLAFKNPITFDAIKNIFPNAHIEVAKGTPQQASEYCTKEDTRIGDAIVWGELPIQGKRNDLKDIYQMLKDSCSLSEVRDTYPVQYIMYQPRIQTVYQEILAEKFGKTFRKLKVIYLHGETGIGKTRYVMEKYGYENVFSVANYKNPFDAYSGQSVIIFEEFRSSLPIEEMLRYLDGYPIRLPARYGDKVACYITVYIISNWELSEQYQYIQEKHPKTFDAFMRRISFSGNLETVKSYNQNLEESEDKDIVEVAIDFFGDKVVIKE